MLWLEFNRGRTGAMEHLVPWLTLKSVAGIGDLLFYRLIAQFGSPDKVLAASYEALALVQGMSPRLARAIGRHRTPDCVLRDLDRCSNKGFQVITQQDQRYPALLLEIADPPPVLYCYGHLDGADCHIAVVGSRKATAYGQTSAKRLCRDLAARGISIVSGMARGIDTAAHLGALEGGGRTVAVLGSGLEQVYPPENLRLFHRIAEHGAVITEFDLDAEPLPHHFPRRNRIISGMALGTVVVEAAKRSGSLITARLAAEQGREVYAVPGSIHAPTAQGTHDLIRQGAKLAANADDIIEEVAARMQKPADKPAEPGGNDTGRTFPAGPALSDEEARLLEAIGPYPVHIDELARQCRQDMGRLTALLLQLELKGAIDQEPGKFFQAKPLETLNRVK
jgi:DNA processing protein